MRLQANPILQAELAHLRRSARRWPRYLRLAGRVGAYAALMLALILFGGELAGALTHRVADPIAQRLGIAVPLLTVVTVTLYAALMLQTLMLAANSLVREKQNGAWDMLVLTGIDARQIVRGKWWALLAKLGRRWLLLGVLWAGLLVWHGGSKHRELLYSPYFSHGYGYTGVYFPAPGNIILAGAAVVALTSLNMLLTAACGLAASAWSGRPASALVGAIALRILVIFGLLAALSLLSRVLEPAWTARSEQGIVLHMTLGLMGATMLDTGLAASYSLTRYRYAYRFAASPDYTAYDLLGVVVSISLFVLFIWLLLRLAEWQVVHQSALPRLRRPSPSR